MMKQTVLFTFLILSFCIADCASDSGVRVYVTNEDTETINTLHIFASEKEYLIEDIPPGQTKDIIIRIKGKTKVLFMADSGVILGNSVTFLAPIPKGEMRIGMTKETINSSVMFGIE